MHRGRAATSAPAAWSCRRISAVDIALWDLKARLLDVPLADAARPRPRPRCRSTAPAGSPPSTTPQLAEQVDGWAGGRLHRDEDQDRRVLGQPTSTATWHRVGRLRELAGDRRRADGRRQRRLHPRAGPPGRRRARRARAWSGSRSRSAATTSTGLARAARRGALRRRRRRVRRRPLRRPRGCCPVGRLPAARRHPLRRLHRLAARRRPRRTRTTCRSPRTAHRPCTRRSPPPSPTCATSSGSPTTPASSRCSSTALPDARGGALHPDADAAGTRHDDQPPSRAMVHVMTPRQGPSWVWRRRPPKWTGNRDGQPVIGRTPAPQTTDAPDQNSLADSWRLDPVSLNPSHFRSARWWLLAEAMLLAVRGVRHC